MIPFPNISPEVFSVDLFGVKFALRWYAVSYILGFICAIKLMKMFIIRKSLWKADNPPLETDQADSLLTYLILGVIIGGRLGYVLFYNFGIIMKIQCIFCAFGTEAWHFMVDLQA